MARSPDPKPPAEARKLSLAELRDVVGDPVEIAKGAKLFDAGGLEHLARHGRKLFADSTGPHPHKVSVAIEERSVRAWCTCMAARSRPFCKHACGLLVAWARQPEAFVESATPPEGDEPQRRRQVKRGKVDPKEPMRRGVAQVATLLSELAVAGVAAVGMDRVDQVRSLGEGLRELRLRRLSSRTLRLADHLERAAEQTGAFDAPEYAELFADMLLTARKLERHVEGEPLQEEHVDQLVGKTWTKKDRRPITGLDLVEYAFFTKTTPEDFLIRESRFFDLASGEHFSEKQILPGFLVRRTVPKRSWSGRVLRRVEAGVFPGYPPKRLDIGTIGETVPLDSAAVARLVDRALPDASAVLRALEARKRDVFAPEALAVAMRVDGLFAEEQRLRLVDAAGAALFLPNDRAAEERLALLLRGTRLVALCGDVTLDGALPTFFPHAAVVGWSELELRPIGGFDAAVFAMNRKLRREALLSSSRPSAARWAQVARAAGAGEAAIALGEVREEMADGLALGLASVAARFTDPLVSRLRDLGLVKQAELLASLATRDPADKLDDFIKLHRVLGIALTRVAGATHVDRSLTEPAPTYDSVFVRRVEETLPPAEVAALRGSGEMNRYEAAVHYDRHFASLPADALAASVYPTWADGSAAPFIVRRVAASPTEAIEAARRVLDAGSGEAKGRSVGRVAKLTALRVLEAVGTDQAKHVVVDCIRRRAVDSALVAHAQDALARLEGARCARPAPEQLVHAALHAATQEGRIDALRALGEGGYVDAIPVLRASSAADVAAGVRAAAATALADVGDVESVEVFIRMLEERATDPESARAAARALGVLGDARGVEVLLRAFEDGFASGTVAEALIGVGAPVLGPLVDRLEERPDLAPRKAALGLIASISADVVGADLLTRVSRLERGDLARASLYWLLATEHPAVAQSVATQLERLFGRPDASKEEQSLARKCRKALSRA